MPIEPGKIILVRHAQCEANRAGVICGTLDSPLSKHGLETAQSHSIHVANPRWTVYSSPLLRAKHTAEALFPNEKILISDHLKEIHYGNLEEGRIDGNRSGLQQIGRQWKGMNSQAEARYLENAKALLESSAPYSIFFSHGGFINLFLHLVLGVDTIHFPFLILDNLHAVVIQKKFDNESWLLKASNIGPEHWKNELEL